MTKNSLRSLMIYLTIKYTFYNFLEFILHTLPLTQGTQKNSAYFEFLENLSKTQGNLG